MNKVYDKRLGYYREEEVGVFGGFVVIIIGFAFFCGIIALISRIWHYAL